MDKPKVIEVPLLAKPKIVEVPLLQAETPEKDTELVPDEDLFELVAEA